MDVLALGVQIIFFSSQAGGIKQTALGSDPS